MRMSSKVVESAPVLAEEEEEEVVDGLKAMQETSHAQQQDEEEEGGGVHVQAVEEVEEQAQAVKQAQTAQVDSQAAEATPDHEEARTLEEARCIPQTPTPQEAAAQSSSPQTEPIPKTPTPQAQARAPQRKRHTRSFEATITDFDCRDPLEGAFHIDAAVSSFVLKGEDKYTFVTSTSEPCLTESQECPSTKSPHGTPQLVAFMGVFDGHDGPAASEYCSHGLLPHILSETKECASKVLRDTHHTHDNHDASSPNVGTGSVRDMDRSILKEGHIAGFQRAQGRFAARMDPPTFANVRQGVKKVRAGKSIFERLFCAPQRQIRGGTTACTLALYTRKQKAQSKTKNPTSTPLHSAVIANTGDSRCITDDATGTYKFRQVTHDHRPFKAEEYRRLKPFIARGDAVLERDLQGGALRLYPGGLAVSRTIGDMSLARAAVPTPEVFFSPLPSTTNPHSHTQTLEQNGNSNTTSNGTTTPNNHHNNNCNGDSGSSLTATAKPARHRFILASDGLWDVFNNRQVGKLGAARVREKKTTNHHHHHHHSHDDAGEDYPSASSSSSSSEEEEEHEDEFEEVFVPPKEAARKIIDACIKHGGYEDDVTVMVVDVWFANCNG